MAPRAIQALLALMTAMAAQAATARQGRRRAGGERQAQGQGFVQHRVKQGVQGAALGLPGVHARQVLRMGR